MERAAPLTRRGALYGLGVCASVLRARSGKMKFRVKFRVKFRGQTGSVSEIDFSLFRINNLQILLF
jgi:hypothetical protein